jgi:pimeloyl-ACP methyl ester carboxylesterase
MFPADPAGPRPGRSTSARVQVSGCRSRAIGRNGIREQMARRFVERAFSTGLVEINYAEGPPAGPPLVLLHGLAARWQLFTPLMPALSERWHLYAPDFRGHGKSGRVPGHYRVGDFVEDTRAFIQAQLTGPAVIYGHSLGGGVAASVAAELPDLVRALVIGDTALHPARSNPGASLSYLDDMPVALRSLSTAKNQLDPEVMAMFRDGRMMDGFHPEAVLRRIACPVLLLQGNPALGAVMTDEDVVRALAVLAEATHVRFDNLGHGLHVQDPEPVLAAVTSFLESL